MEQSPAQAFLDTHRSEIIKRTRTPVELADHLRGKGKIRDEMYSNIEGKETSQLQMREIYKYLNSNEAFECVYEWLKKNEPHLIKELENNSNTENEAPERKRPRSQTDEVMDETDSVNKLLDLKTLNTSAKLEDWASDPTNNQNLINNLEKKLAPGEMEALEGDLKDKRLRSSLRINAKDFHDIKSNRDLQSYLNAATGAKFPRKLTVKTFFEKDSEYVSPVNDSLNMDINESYTDDDESRGSSGYKSQLSLSLKSNQSQLGNVSLSQNNNSVNNNIGDTKVQHSEKIPSESPPKTGHVFQNDLLCPEDDSPEEMNGVLSQNKPLFTPITNDKETTPVEEAMDIQVDLGETSSHLDSETVKTGSVSYNNITVLEEASDQNVGFQICPLNKVAETDWQLQTPIPQHADVLCVTYGQHQPMAQLQLKNKDNTPQTINMDIQENVCEPNKQEQEMVQFLSPSSCSTPLNDPKKNKSNRRHKQITSKLEKKKQRKILLCNWARKECNNGNMEEIKKVLDSISIKDVAEHSEYPFLLAEKLRVYDNKETGERQIIVFSDEENNSSKTRTLIHYQMFVCGIKKTVILGEKEQEINFDTSNVPVDRCLKFILEAFVPALAVYKNMQRKEMNSLL